MVRKRARASRACASARSSPGRGCESTNHRSAARRSSWRSTRMPEHAEPRTSTRILLADDHAVVRRGLRLVLDREPDLRVTAEVGDGAAAVQRALERDIDLAILDVSMPRL